MVYVRPTIEWFLPVIMTTSQRDLAQTNPIEVFQQRMLAKIFGIPNTVSRFQLNKYAAEPSVKEKIVTMATRLAKHYPRDVKYLKYGHANPSRLHTASEALRMRRGRNIVR